MKEVDVPFNVRILYPGKSDWDRELERIDVDKYAVGIFRDKRDHYLIKISGVRIEAANIIKQDALSSGCDAAIPRSAISGKPSLCSVIIIADKRKLRTLGEKLKHQPFSLAGLYGQICDKLDEGERFFQAGNKKLDLKRTLVMGILNITPDSFYDGGRYSTLKDIAFHVESMIKQGADIIDIGAESTRPGSKAVDKEAELNRLLPVIKTVREVSADIPVSVDTYKSSVAEQVLGEGADIINDISGGTFDEQMFKTVARNKCGYIIMHIKGTPGNMQKDPVYEDVMNEINVFLSTQTGFAQDAGVSKKSIVVDPGIGFGKRLEDNLEIIRRLKEFRGLGYPLLMGLSRKSFLGMLTGRNADQRLAATIAAHGISIVNGADIIRVHDVSAGVDAVKVTEGILYGKG